MADQKNTVTTGNCDGESVQCSKCIAVSILKSDKNCPERGEKLTDADKIEVTIDIKHVLKILSKSADQEYKVISALAIARSIVQKNLPID